MSPYAVLLENLGKPYKPLAEIAENDGMRTCKCGGMWYRNGATEKPGGERYVCKECGTNITVRDGEIVTNRRGPRVNDWRVLK